MRASVWLLGCLVLVSACAGRVAVADAPGSTGHDFLIAPFADFRLGRTTPEEVARALVGQPTGSPSLNIDFDVDKRFEGRKLLLLQYAYSPHGKCSPEKWADATFINGTLQTYHVFSVLPGDFAWPDARKLASIKPGVTSRQGVIDALGMPNTWTTGRGLTKDGGEALGYDWVTSGQPGIVNSVVFAVDRRGLVAAAPVTGGRRVDRTTNWICRYPPPVP